MSITIAELETVLRGNNADLLRVLSQSRSAVGDFASDTGSALLKAGAAMTAAFTAPLAAISEMGRNFETTLRQVAANTALTDAELNTMRDTIISIGRDTSAPLNDLARGYERITNFGFAAADAANILSIAQQAATATGAQTASVSNALAGVLHEFSLSGQEASNVMNTLQLAAAHGNLRLEEFAAVSGKLFSTAANLGLGLGETAAAFSALTRSGLPAAQASTALASAIVHIVEPSAGVRKELAALSKTTGIDLVRDFSQAGLQSKGLSGVLDDLAKAVGNNTSKAFELTGGIRGGIAALGLIGNASQDYKKNLDDLAQTMSGKLTPVQDAYKRETASLGFQFGELKNRLTILGDTLNKAFSSTQVGLIKGISDAVDAVTRGFAALDPVAQKAILTLVGGFAISGPLLLGIGALVTFLGGPVTIAIVALTGMVSVLAAEWVTNTGKMTGSSFSVKDAIAKVIDAVGILMDAFGVFGNVAAFALGTVALAVQAVIAPLILLGALPLLLTGQFAQYGRVVSSLASMWDSTTRFISRSWSDMTADMNGRWRLTLNGMVQDGYAAASGFFGAGQKAGAGWRTGWDAGFASTAQYNAAFESGMSKMRHAAQTDDMMRTPMFKRKPAPLTPEEKQAIDFVVDQALKHADESVKKHPPLKPPPFDGAGAKKAGHDAGKALLDGFKEGLKGFEEALDKVLTEAEKTDTLSKLAKRAMEGGKDYVAALKVVTTGVNEFLSFQGVAAKVTKEEVDKMAKDGDTLLLAYAGSWKRAQEAVRLAGIEMASSLQRPLSEINDLLKENNIDLRVSAEFYSHLSDSQKTSVAVLDQYAQAAKINRQNQDELKLSIAANTIEQNKAAAAALFSNGALGLLHGTADSVIKTALGGVPAFASYKAAMNAAFVIGSQGSIVAVTSLQEKIKTLKDAIHKSDVSAIASAMQGLRGELSNLATVSGKSSADVNKALDGVVGGMANMSSKSRVAVDATTASWRTLKESLTATLNDIKNAIESNAVLMKAKFAVESRTAINSAISDFERYGIQLGKSGQQLQDWVEIQVRKAFGNNTTITQAGLDAAIEVHRKAAIQLPGIWGPIFDKLGALAKSWASAIFGVLDTIPGHFGDAARSVLKTVETWIQFADKVLAVLHRMNSDIPASLADLANKVVGIFHGINRQVTIPLADLGKQIDDSLGAIGDLTVETGAMGVAIGKAGDGVQTGASKMVSGLAQIAGAVLAFTGAKGAGVVQGAFSGALGGIAAAGGIATALGIALSPLTLGLSAAAGALLGGILGLFGGGLSAAQKQQQALQNDKLKADIAATTQATLNAALDGVSKALDLADKAGEFVSVSKKKIAKIFSFMTQVVNGFIEASKQWNAENLQKAKAAAENITPVFQALTALPAAEKAINSSFGVSDAQIDEVFDALGRIVNRWEVKATDWTKSETKRIGKIAENLAPAVNLVSPLVTAIADMNKIEDVSDEKLAIVDRSLDKLVSLMNTVAERYDKSVLKSVQNAAEKIAPVIAAEKDVVGLIRDTIDLPMPKESDADNLVNGMVLFVDRLNVGFANFDTAGLGKTLSIVQAIAPVPGALKEWASAADAIRNYTAIGESAWSAAADDFSKSLLWLDSLMVQALSYLDKTKAFDDTITAGNAHLTNAITSYIGTLNSAFGALNSAFGAIQSGVIGGAPDSTSAGSFAPQSFNAPHSFIPSHRPAPAVVHQDYSVNIGDIYLPAGDLAPEGLRRSVIRIINDDVVPLLRQAREARIS